MTEPDFEQIARGFCDAWATYTDQQKALTDLLRQVWNARGAADAIVVAEDHDFLFAIKALDR